MAAKKAETRRNIPSHITIVPATNFMSIKEMYDYLEENPDHWIECFQSGDKISHAPYSLKLPTITSLFLVQALLYKLKGQEEQLGFSILHEASVTSDFIANAQRLQTWIPTISQTRYWEDRRYGTIYAGKDEIIILYQKDFESLLGQEALSGQKWIEAEKKEMERRKTVRKQLTEIKAALEKL